jgi:hypothetical protein
MRIGETYTTCRAEESQRAIDVPTDGRTVAGTPTPHPPGCEPTNLCRPPYRHVFVPKKVRVRAGGFGDDDDRARSCSQPATNRALHPLMRYGRVPAAAGWPHGTCVPRQESPIDHREPRVAIRTALIGVAVTVAVDGWTPPFLSGVVRSFLHGADPSPSSASLALRSSLGASSPSS